MLDLSNAPLLTPDTDAKRPNISTLVVLSWAIVLATYICVTLIFVSLISFFSPTRTTPMLNESITKEQAEAYKAKKGHYPLIIGEEYLYMSNFVELIEASSDHNSIVVRSRFGDRATISIEDLDWKPARKPKQ